MQTILLIVAAAVVLFFIAQARMKNLRAKRVWEEAWAAFAAKYPERKILKSWRRNAQRDAAGRIVICVTWGDPRSEEPERSWWQQRGAGKEFEEISAAQAAQLINAETER